LSMLKGLGRKKGRGWYLYERKRKNLKVSGRGSGEVAVVIYSLLLQKAPNTNIWGGVELPELGKK